MRKASKNQKVITFINGIRLIIFEKSAHNEEILTQKTLPTELIKFGTPLLSPNTTKDITLNLKMQGEKQSTLNSETSG